MPPIGGGALNSTSNLNSTLAFTSMMSHGVLDDDFQSTSSSLNNSNQQQQMIVVNTFTIPLYTPIFIQNKSNSKYLSVPNQLSSLLSTRQLFKSQLDLLMNNNNSSSSTTPNDQQQQHHHQFGLLNNIDLSYYPTQSSSPSSPPPSSSALDGDHQLVVYKEEEEDKLPSNQSSLTTCSDLIMSDKPNIKFIYSGESNFHIIESKSNDFLYINHHVLDCKLKIHSNTATSNTTTNTTTNTNSSVYLNVLNGELSQKWHIGKCNSTPLYCIIRSIENPKLKLYHDDGTGTVYLKEEIDNIAELDDGFLWKFILQEIPQYKYMEKLLQTTTTSSSLAGKSSAAIPQPKFKTLSKLQQPQHFNTTTSTPIGGGVSNGSNGGGTASNRSGGSAQHAGSSKLFMTALPSLQLELSPLNSILTGIFLSLKDVGSGNQFFRITNDGFIEAKMNPPKNTLKTTPTSTPPSSSSSSSASSSGSGSGLLVVTWDLEENKITLARNEQLTNQKWIFVPHDKNHSMFSIRSVYDPIYVLHSYRVERHALLCIKELESDDSKEDYYWIVSD